MYILPTFFKVVSQFEIGNSRNTNCNTLYQKYGFQIYFAH